MMRLLVIEDDEHTGSALQRGLQAEGYEVRWARTGEEGFFEFHAAPCDLVVLDWMLPGRDGLEVLSRLRQLPSPPPVLMLTARDAVQDRVHGLEAGADDYLVKPFAFPELLARVRTLLRRAGENQTGLRRRVGDLQIDYQARRVWRGETELNLTPREFELLGYLALHAGRIVTREMLAADVWRETNRATPIDNVIDVHMANLRKKLEQNGGPKRLQTLRGLGFVLKGDEG
jgi:two-component system copper resistance phosphate regulon response regulator CusR